MKLKLDYKVVSWERVFIDVDDDKVEELKKAISEASSSDDIPLSEYGEIQEFQNIGDAEGLELSDNANYSTLELLDFEGELIAKNGK